MGRSPNPGLLTNIGHVCHCSWIHGGEWKEYALLDWSLVAWQQLGELGPQRCPLCSLQIQKKQNCAWGFTRESVGLRQLKCTWLAWPCRVSWVVGLTCWSQPIWFGRCTSLETWGLRIILDAIGLQKLVFGIYHIWTLKKALEVLGTREVQDICMARHSEPLLDSRPLRKKEDCNILNGVCSVTRRRKQSNTYSPHVFLQDNSRIPSCSS